MAAMNRKYIYNPCIFGFVRNSNKIPTTLPMFPGSGNTDRLPGILSYVLACWKSKMAAINRKYMVNYS